MEKSVRCWIPLVLLAAWSHVMQGDPYHHMKDAFAEDTADRGPVCRRNEMTTVCRLRNLQKSILDHLDPCLCTHLIFPEGSEVAYNSFRQSNPDLLYLLTTPMEVLLEREDAVHELVESVRKGGSDGVDLTIWREARRSEFLGVLQELHKQLTSPRKRLHLTFVKNVPPPPLITEILSLVDVASFTFFADFTRNETENIAQLEQIWKLGIPRNKTLQGVSLTSIGKVSFENTTFPHQRCSQIPHESGHEEVSSSRGESTGIIQTLRHEVKYVKENKAKTAGIDIWSLDYDDAQGVCGKGFFPILHYISHATNQDPQPFDEFADLDIVLSTGESQELQFLQDLDVTPEEIKKLPCDRVGFYRHPSDCSKFYHCSEYRTTKRNYTGPYAGFLYKCPNGLVYDERQGSCIWASWSEPCPGSGELLPVPAKRFSCVVPGFHVDPENCRWFYYCSDLGDGRLEAFEFQCPSDLLGYDEKKMLCNWKWTVSACVNYGKQSEANTESFSTPKTQVLGNRTLKLEGTQVPFTPLSSHTTRKPRRRKLIQRERQSHNTEKSEISVPTDAYVSTHDELQQYATTDSSREIIDNIKDSEMINKSSPQERLANERQNLPEKKYGTAVWRRSWVNDGTQNNRAATSQISISDAISENNRLNKRRLNGGENNQQSNRNNLQTGINERLPSIEDDNEPVRFFKGVVKKINIDGGIDEAFDLRPKDGKNVERETSTRVKNPQEFAEPKSHDQRDNNNDYIFRNRQKTELNRDTGNFPVQNRSKNVPFLNVRCSKLQTGNSQPEEIGAFGCTSEVSLTIQVRSGKDPSKYILKEDKIIRTALQESKQIRYIETPPETNANNLGSNANKAQQRIDSPASFTSPAGKTKRNESSDTFILESSNFASKGADVLYTTKLNNGSPNVSSHATQSSKLTDENNIKIPNSTNNEHLLETNSDSIKSLPIHFYPQGVLLNIDIARINEIPPRILLEVDNMLKTYMNDGNIDLNLLERRLNASTESMAGRENESMEHGEIMEMIKVIQNIINTSRERETATAESNPSNTGVESSTINLTEVYIGTVSETNEEIEYENISSRSISDKYLISEGNGQFKETNTPKDKIQNPEVSPNNSKIASNQEPFGRRRLLRKFSYPSIREQLERQNKFRNVQETYKNPHSETAPSIINRSDTISYASKRDGIQLDQTDTGVVLNSDGQSVSIQTMSPKTDHTDSQPLTQQYEGGIIASEPRIFPEETYSSAGEPQSNKAENNVLRPLTVQYENSRGEERDNWRTFQEDINVYPTVKQIFLPTDSSKNIDTGYSRTLERDRNFEVKTFQNYTYRHTPYNQAQRNDAFQPSPLQYDSQAQAWGNRRTPQYTSAYVSLKPIPVTASYDKNINIQDSRLLGKDTGNFETKTFHESKYSPFNQASRKVQENDYGDRTKISENRTFHDGTYVHSSYKLNSYFGRNTEAGNSRRFQENIGKFEERSHDHNSQTNIPISTFQREGHFLYNYEQDKSEVEAQFRVTSDNAYDFYTTKSENTPLPGGNEAEKSFTYRQSEQSVRANGMPALNSGFANVGKKTFDTNIAQAKKKRKLRILVRKLTDNVSVPRHESLPMNIEKNDLQQKISKNVLNAVKSRFLQKHASEEAGDIELQIRFQDHVWNIPFVNSDNEAALSPAVCTRPGLFQHPRDCNMFYECFWDKWLQRFTLHVFSCPVKLVYDESVRGCNRPSADTPCRSFTR